MGKNFSAKSGKNSLEPYFAFCAYAHSLVLGFSNKAAFHLIPSLLVIRSRLSYEQFSAFLANVKELNAHKQTKEV